MKLKAYLETINNQTPIIIKTASHPNLKLRFVMNKSEIDPAFLNREIKKIENEWEDKIIAIILEEEKYTGEYREEHNTAAKLKLMYNLDKQQMNEIYLEYKNYLYQQDVENRFEAICQNIKNNCPELNINIERAKQLFTESYFKEILNEYIKNVEKYEMSYEYAIKEAFSEKGEDLMEKLQKNNRL